MTFTSPEQEMQVKFGDIIKYISERIEQEINLKLGKNQTTYNLAEPKKIKITCEICGKECERYEAEAPQCSECFHSEMEKRRKADSIKQMAWEFILATVVHLPKKNSYRLAPLEAAWEVAEKFYDYAKEKKEKKEKMLDDNET